VTGLVVVAVALVVALLFGWYRHRTDGRVRQVSESTHSATVTEEVTLLQFSSEFCAPCRRARPVLSELAETHEAITHIEVDVAAQPDLARQYAVTRTPTILVLDGTDTVRHKVVGEVRPAEFRHAVMQLLEPVSVRR
jgi:thiol-disulfide isomerase/thioredoxin